MQAVKGISDLINIRGLINLDFADIRTIMSAKGMAIMGTGRASGENRAVEAASASISSPLLENISIEGATGIIINVTGGPDLSLYEVNEASTLITEAAHEDAEIIFGAVIDETMGDEVRVTVIATGFGREHEQARVDYHNQQVAALNQQMKSNQQVGQLNASMSQHLAPVQAPVFQAPSVSFSAPSVQVEAAPEMLEEQFLAEEELSHSLESSPETSLGMQASPAAEKALPRDILLAKARAYRDSQAQRAKQPQPEQLSMEVQPDGHALGSLEMARRLANEVVKSPFDQRNLDVPTYMRRKDHEEQGL